MSRVKICFSMTLQSDAIFSSGHSIPGGEDISLRMTVDHKPYMAGSTFKGLLREQLENWLNWTGNNKVEKELQEMLGEADRGGVMNERRVAFTELHIDEGIPESEWYSSRVFTALEDGIVKKGTLRTATCLNCGLIFSGAVFCNSNDVDVIKNSIKCIKWVGLLRNRGFGEVRLEIKDEVPLQVLKDSEKIKKATCLRYIIKLETPLAVSSIAGGDRYRQEAGVQREDVSNYTETLDHIPGSTVRGMVISWLAQNRPEWFAENKKALLGDGTRFLGAFPIINGCATIPTPKGFYADKREEKFYSALVTGKVESSHKRANLGSFCYITQDNKIKGFTPKTQSIMRIRHGDDKQVFTSTVLLPETVWEGYIQLENPEIAEYIAQAFQEKIWLGADRYAGYGCCEVSGLNAVERVDRGVGYRRGDTPPEQLYMMALSPFAMTRDGELIGIDTKWLKEKLGVHSLKITRCATSVVEVNGFNRTWQCAIPSVIMYDKGSIFQLECTPKPQVDKLMELENAGIGIRRSEGFGQITFIKNYKQLRKAPEEGKARNQQTMEQIVRQARCKWLLENKFPRDNPSMSNSQIGELQALCEQAIALEGQLSHVWNYFEHNIENRGAKHGERFKKTKECFENILNKTLEETLRLPENIECSDSTVERLRLICDWMDLSRKEG